MDSTDSPVPGHDVFEFFETRRSIRRSLFVNLFFLALGAFLALLAAGGDLAVAVVLAPVALIMLLVSLLGLVNGVRRALRRSPRVVIDAIGIRDANWGGVTIPWSAVMAVGLTDMEESPLIVELLDAHSYFPRLKVGEKLIEGAGYRYVTYIRPDAWTTNDFARMVSCAQAAFKKSRADSPRAQAE
jgi:hypothetical protein